MNDTDIYLQNKFIKTRLANIRKSKGLSQLDLSNITGLATSTISKIESGETSYNLISLIKYVEGLGYEINIDKKAGEDNGNTEETDKRVSDAST